MRRAALALCGLIAASAASAQAQVRFGGNEAGGAIGLHVTSYRDLPFRTVVRQQYDFSCGSAALATLLTFHYDKRTSEADAFREMYARGDQTKIRKLGFSLLDMQTYLRAHGLQADGFRLSWVGLEEVNTPSIAMINIKGYKHFVVIKGVRDGKVLIGDPAIGLKTYSRREFEAMWNGVVFYIRDKRTEAVFNSGKEWEPYAPTPWGVAHSSSTLAEGLSREAAPLYQISPVFNLDTIR